MISRNHIIDYTYLEDSHVKEKLQELCKNALLLKVRSVCTWPDMILYALEILQNQIPVCTVISFPDGTNTLYQKIAETEKAIKDGVREIDMVLNYHLLKEDPINNKAYLIKEVKSVAQICLLHNVVLKVIIESGALDFEETRIATEICLEGKANFIKTSTGRKDKEIEGAEADKIKIMKGVIKEKAEGRLYIKASGGINAGNIKKFIAIADRIGMSAEKVDKLPENEIILKNR